MSRVRGGRRGGLVLGSRLPKTVELFCYSADAKIKIGRYIYLPLHIVSCGFPPIFRLWHGKKEQKEYNVEKQKCSRPRAWDFVVIFHYS